jgi:predicted nucleic acid-binding protein
VETAARTFVDTDVLIGVARRAPRALDFWHRVEERSLMTCSIMSVFELLGGCRNLKEQRDTLRDLLRVDIIQVETGDSRTAMRWYRAFHLSHGIGFIDCFIAAAAARLDCVLHSRNTKHFRVIPGLRLKPPY